MEEIMDKYAKEERELEERIRECERLHEELKSKNDIQSLSSKSLSEIQDRHKKAEARNQQILEDLKKKKAVLRTESSFSPSEQELYQLAEVYRSFLEAPEDPST